MHAKFIAFILHKTHIRHVARLLSARTMEIKIGALNESSRVWKDCRERKYVRWGSDESSLLVIASVDLLFST